MKVRERANDVKYGLRLKKKLELKSLLIIKALYGYITKIVYGFNLIRQFNLHKGNFD